MQLYGKEKPITVNTFIDIKILTYPVIPDKICKNSNIVFLPYTEIG